MKVKVVSPELRKRSRKDIESLKESLDILRHNALCSLTVVTEADKFRWSQGYLQALEDIISLTSTT